MPKTDKKSASNKIAIEKRLWSAANKLRKNIDVAEYKRIALGLIFLKYISDSFEALYNKLQEGKGKYKGVAPEDRDEYKAENVFFVPLSARWSYLCSRAKQPEIGKDIDFNLAEKFKKLKSELAKQMKEEATLNKRILKKLKKYRLWKIKRGFYICLS